MEESRKLFPIILKEHNPQYMEWYEAEKRTILSNINTNDIARINHIGSSAIKGLIAKSTIDILLEMDGCCHVTQLMDDLIALGWRLMHHEKSPMRLVFNKGYTPDGFAKRVYHLHVRYLGNWHELYFKDYLMNHPDVAEDYGKLKLKLEKDFKYDRDNYTNAKTEFIVKYSNIAKQVFQDKYKP